jgi:hypothetical protein
MQLEGKAAFVTGGDAVAEVEAGTPPPVIPSVARNLRTSIKTA